MPSNTSTRAIVGAVIRSQASRLAPRLATGPPRPLPPEDTAHDRASLIRDRASEYQAVRDKYQDGFRTTIDRGHYPDAYLGACCFCVGGFLGYKYGTNRFGRAIFMCSDCVFLCWVFPAPARIPPASEQLLLVLAEKTGTAQ
jgi:hypothetical protein